eukprot:10168963-Alexandrium_andersonii.AAC.1
MRSSTSKQFVAVCNGLLRILSWGLPPPRTIPKSAPEALFAGVRGAVAPPERPRTKPLQTAAN